jgi:phosphatidylglycerol:prolipoprotein diacylglycerol transferase
MEAGKNVRISQLLALCIILAAFVIIILRRKMIKDPIYYADPIFPDTKAGGMQREV